MRMILIISAATTGTIISIILFLGIHRTWLIQHSSNQKIFLTGKIPNPKPDGLYKGKVNFKTTWMGKKFDANSSTGINIIDNKENYPFKTYTGKGIQDKSLDVFRIDYNIPQNPFWLRFILDEIVQVDKDRYLGKVHINLIPGLPFTLGYFKLEK